MGTTDLGTNSLELGLSCEVICAGGNLPKVEGESALDCLVLAWLSVPLTLAEDENSGVDGFNLEVVVGMPVWGA